MPLGRGANSTHRAGWLVGKGVGLQVNDVNPWDSWLWYVHLHLIYFYGECIDEDASPMDPMGLNLPYKNNPREFTHSFRLNYGDLLAISTE